MDPNSGGNQPEASFASTIASALANFTGKSREGEKEQENHTQPAVAESDRSSAVAMTDHKQELIAATGGNSGSMDTAEASAPSDEKVEEYSPPTEDYAEENSVNETQASFAKEETESKMATDDVEMGEETESTGVEDDPTSKQLQAVVGEQTLNVKITANDEIVVDDDTADGDGKKL